MIGSALVIGAGLLAAAWFGWRFVKAGKSQPEAAATANAPEPSAGTSPVAAASAEKDYELGLDYYRGGGKVLIDRKRAFECFELAASQGLPEAEVELGRLYDEARLWEFPELSNERAASWGKKAWDDGIEGRANQGLHRAEYELAELYSNGLGIPRDQDKAL